MQNTQALSDIPPLHCHFFDEINYLKRAETPQAMEKLAPVHHHLIRPLHQTPPLTHNSKPRTHLSPSSLSLASTTATSFEATSSSPCPSPMHLPYFRVLDGSSPAKTLVSVKAMHAQMMKRRNQWGSDSMAKTLITAYLELGDFRSAAMVFFVRWARNYSMWNSFLQEFESFGGDPREVLEVFRELYRKGVSFDGRVLTLVLKICSAAMDLWLGLEVHACLIKSGLESDSSVKSALMSFFERCWGVEGANQVFHELRDRDDNLWNEAIIMNLKNERWIEALNLFREMQFFSSAKANVSAILKMLQACGKEGAINEGRQIHGYVLKHGLESNLSICNSLITMYSRNGRLKLARRVFDSMKHHNLSSWNSIISSHTAVGLLDDAWNLFHMMELSNMKPDIVTWNCLLSGCSLHSSFNQVFNILQRMQDAGFRPNSSSITSLLQAVIELRLLKIGKEIHGYAVRNRLDYDVYVETSLIDMYVKNDCLTSSRSIFDNMENKNIVAWNSIISGYSFKGLFDDAKWLLNGMQEKGMKPDLVTWNCFVSGYSMWGQSKEALSMIHDIKSSGLTPNVVSWTALVSGCSQNGKYREALQFFIQMQQEGIRPNSVTLSSLLRTCGGLSLLQSGKEIHCVSTKNGFIEDIFIATALIDMYSSSGDLKSAQELFGTTKNKTLACWNCMIMGFATYGLGREAISFFNQMQAEGVLPDAITFTSLISACKNSGFVAEGWRYFDSMSKDFNISPRIEHYSCMVDLLGRAGYLDEAWDFIQTMPFEPDASIWGAFLGSCRIHGNKTFGEIAAKELFKLEPQNSANYVLMMQLYAISNRWEDVERIKGLMDVNGVKNGPVWSWIQIDQRVHVFSAGGRPRDDEGEIYFELNQLFSEMKKCGYVPDISGVNQNIVAEEKEKILLSHTEKLAITYGLIKTSSSSPIRVIKNTRICSDCHTAAKFMSLVRSREIFIRDGVRFHHFKGGKCSCNDYW